MVPALDSSVRDLGLVLGTGKTQAAITKAESKARAGIVAKCPVDADLTTIGLCANTDCASYCGTCNGTCGSVLPGLQLCGRNHTDTIDGGAIGPPVIAFAVASSQKSGLPFSTDAQVVQM